MALSNWFRLSHLVFVAMLQVQVITAGSHLLHRVVLGEGTFVFALLTYRFAVSFLSTAPFALFFERSHKKKFGWAVCFGLFANGVTGLGFAGFYYYGLKDTTATYASNFFNLIPIFTFILSIISLTEKLEIHTKLGQIKTLGVLLSFAGALAASLYKGKELFLGHHHHTDSHITAQISHTHWTRGTFLLIASCLSNALWLIVQRKLLDVFPFKYTAIMLQSAISTLQSAVIGLCLDRRIVAWKLGWNLELLTIVSSGMLSTAASFVLISWAASIRGPTYPAMFNPLPLIFVTISEALIFGEAIRVGTLIGMILIVAGLYSFLWGSKKQEIGNLGLTKGEEVDNELGNNANIGPAKLELTTKTDEHVKVGQ